MELNTLTRYESIASEMRRLSAAQRTPRPRHHDDIEHDAHSYRLAKHAVGHSLKGFLVGFGGRLLFSLIPALLRSRNPARFLRVVASRLADRDPYAYGLFVAVMLGGYNSIMASTRHLSGPLARYRGLLAGFASGWAILFLPRGSRSTFALFFLVRALEVLVRTGVAKRLLPAVPHADTGLMMAASAQVIWCWIFKPAVLPRSYVRFLNHHGGRDLRVVRAINDFYSSGRSLPAVGPVNQVRLRRGVPLVAAGANPYDTFMAIIHHEPGHPARWLARFWAAGFGRALRVYLPVFLLPLLVFNHRRLLRAPLGSLRRAAAGVLRSSVFLATYCTNCWAIVFLAERLGVMSSHWNGAVAGAAGGAAVLLEKKARRIELGLYVATQALESLWAVHRAKLGLPPLDAAPIPPALFAFSLAVLMHAFTRRPNTLRSSYRSLLRQVAGSPPAHPRIDAPGPATDAAQPVSTPGEVHAPHAVAQRSPPAAATATPPDVPRIGLASIQEDQES